MIPGTPLTVYYLDDEIDLLEVFQEIYASDDVVVKTFTNGETALASVRAAPPDLMVLDYRLAGLSGEEIARQMDPLIPKVLVSGDFLAPEDHPAFLRVLVKPVPMAVYSELFEGLRAGRL